MPDVKLLDFPYDGWQKKYDLLLRDPYVRKKYDRDKRLRDKFAYIDKYLMDVVQRRGNVLDIGPGPGEFMEVCRYYGCYPIGIDSSEGESQMGDSYWELSKLMAERQRLDILYEGVEHMMNKGGFPFQSTTFDVINSQGSIEMVFRNYMKGPEFSTHMQAKKMSWVIDDSLKDMMAKFISECHRILTTDGILLIYANGCGNVIAYDEFMRKSIGSVGGLEIVWSSGHTMHKMRKI